MKGFGTYAHTTIKSKHIFAVSINQSITIKFVVFDPFNDIDPMLVEVPVEDEQVAMTSDQLEAHCAIGHADESDEDSEWEDIEQRSAFDIFK